MDRSSWKLTDAQLREWLSGLLDAESSSSRRSKRTASCSSARSRRRIRPSSKPSGKTRWSPKEFLFPRSEALYRYNFKGGTVQLEDPPVPEEHQVLFGVRSCDASGLVRLDEIFLSGTKDRLYAARRENTTVVSTACAAADPECFCTAVG